MVRYSLLLSGLLILAACSSTHLDDSPTENKVSKIASNNPNPKQNTLSYIRAYLLTGNVKKAEALFNSIENIEESAQASLLEAELNAAKGDSIEAQRAFLAALNNKQFDLQLNKQFVSENLLDYFCAEHKWPALEGYGEALLKNLSTASASHTELSPSPSNTKPFHNQAISQIGLCFFDQQHWQQASYWLDKLDIKQLNDPSVYLALARLHIIKQQFSAAAELMKSYETSKVKVDAKTLWDAIEVYIALNQAAQVNKYGEHLYSLFPNNEYTRKYIIFSRRQQRRALALQQSEPDQPSSKTVKQPIDIESNPLPLTVAKQASNSSLHTVPEPSDSTQYHVMKKGQTLYRLSKTYAVLIGDLLRWNPNLRVDDIPLGTRIRVSE
ncbi:LysM peptidoglycan-binding domain-containing protein [Paraglaciecola aquimarina]|uniref:LysM peptidoglycan-binding domain-containing protein n=1 Tax=Paraglaciecola aquimarina TaxID=1235557 RepID=A0ABU3SXJ6_9ALTE|nr:LysM peptidoglycan-binding domain-containing protein [Paraglaciecola aquimarina]MDU0354642.1 LysM peptidoglycan-binding domain-containing protein [Paraglaciecola aquimarina]